MQHDDSCDFEKLYESLCDIEGNNQTIPSPYSLNNLNCKYYTPLNCADLLHENKNSLSAFSVNAQSLNAHWDSLNTLLSTVSEKQGAFDFIALTETFNLSPKVNYDLAGYHPLKFKTRNDDDDGHGGVGLYINDQFSFSEREDLTTFIPHVCESLFFEVKINSHERIVVGVVYRPNTQPKADLDQFCEHIVRITDQISKEKKKLQFFLEILMWIC